MSDRNRNTTKFWIGVFIGGLIGAIIIVLLGTKEGKKSRKELEDKGKELLDDLTAKLTEIENQGRDLIERGEEIKRHIETNFEEKKDHLTEEATEKLDRALARVEEMQEKGREETANLRKRLFKNIPKKKA